VRLEQLQIQEKGNLHVEKEALFLISESERRKQGEGGGGSTEKGLTICLTQGQQPAVAEK